jgi:hypothetical protein
MAAVKPEPWLRALITNINNNNNNNFPAEVDLQQHRCGNLKCRKVNR